MGHMLLLALIPIVWISCCAMAVALCIAARRADEDLAMVFLAPDAEEPAVDFVATFAEPQAEAAPAPRDVRSAQRQSA